MDAATGVIIGTPAATAKQLPFTVQVQDSGNPVQAASASLTMDVSPAVIDVTVSPRRAGTTVGRKITLTAHTTDNAGLAWSTSPAAGLLDRTSSGDKETVTFTAPRTAGVYTVTATSKTDPARSTQIPIGVTDLAGVFTYHNNLSRDGVNNQEYALTPANVSTTSFGKLFSCAVDGAIYAQPLWVANVTINGATRNVVFVSTQHDSLYAFDADASPCVLLWKASLIDAKHGGTGSEVPVPAGANNSLVGLGYGDLTPEIGISGTPVIDAARGVLFVVAKSVNAAHTSFYQRLHAIDLATGAERPGSPVTIEATYAGAGDGGTSVRFNTRLQNQRAGLALVNGIVYVAWGSHEDEFPYYGWLMGYSYDDASFSRRHLFNVAPDAGAGGIWMSGAAPAADASGNLYVITGDGRFNAASDTPPNRDYGDSFLKLSRELRVLQYFTPSNETSLSINNADFGAGGAAVLGDLPAGSPVSRLAIGGGKDGTLFVLNRDHLGGLGDPHAWQIIRAQSDASKPRTGALFCVGALWNGMLYIVPSGTPLMAWQLNPATAKFSMAQASTSPEGGFGFPGSTPSISSSGASNGIVWVLDNSHFCTQHSSRCGPAVLHAYDASNVAKELWNSSIVSSDRAGNAIKFVVATVANGKVYVPTRGNNAGGENSSTSTPGELDVYGLKPD